MAESRLIPARPDSPPRRSGARPPLPAPRPVRPLPPPRPPLEETQSLGPPPGPREAREDTGWEPDDRASAPREPRSRAEKALLAVLLLGLGMNLAAFLVSRGRLTPADLLFGAVTLLSGAALLIFTEINRRGGRPRSYD